MKIQMIFISILIILAGVLPFLSETGIIPQTVTIAPGYSFVIIAVGFVSLIYGVMSKMIFGTEKLILILIGLITVLGGILPFLNNFVAIPLPTSGPIYSGLIILIGILAFIYGASRIG